MMVPDQLAAAIESESRKFKECYLWLEKAMPKIFFKEVSDQDLLMICHNLIGLNLQDYFSTIHLKNAAIAICLDEADADLRILKNYAFHGIKNYQVYVSSLPFPNTQLNLRIAVIYFTEAQETSEIPFSPDVMIKLHALTKNYYPDYTIEQSDQLISSINTRFLHSLPLDRLIIAIDLFLSAQSRDNCQYEVHYNQNWHSECKASMQIVLAWRNAPKHNFLYRIALNIHRHNLVIKRVHATYITPPNSTSTLVMTLDLHGKNGNAVWDASNVDEFLRELLTTKYFYNLDAIDSHLVAKEIISGSMGNFLRSAIRFIHQGLVHLDANLYTLESIEEALCRHPELTALLCEAFSQKLNPKKHDFENYLASRELFLANVDKIDTGHEENDNRRKNVLKQGMNFIHHTLKTNFFRTNLTAHSFRLDPLYLDHLPIDRVKKFPVLPYAIFFIKGMNFIGFHIRFKDLARGGLRTVYPINKEQVSHERNNIFTECYNLAFTQHQKNKDIPEGGSKAVLFLTPFERLESESLIFQKELQASSLDADSINKKIEQFRKEQTLDYLHQVQRSFVESLLTIINCDPDGKIRAKNIVDYWKRPEYLYLGPDENMHDEMILWIAELSKKYHYKPGGAFISGKPTTGINHKHYGVTSLGINVYMDTMLKFLDIDPSKTHFTLKMSGGPDGDVAGNQINNLYRYYPETAKLLALIDVSGTIYDPQGLDLNILNELFKQGKPLRYYPPEKLSDGGLLLDKYSKQLKTSIAQQTLCWKKTKNTLEKEWLSSSETNFLLKNTVHQVKADIFIPAGGRPQTLNETNIKEYLDKEGNPSSRAIIEGANLYISKKARTLLEKLGVLIIKDSSANKTGVICSSFEVLCGLALSDAEFMNNKSRLIEEILERLKKCAAQEAKLLLTTYSKTHEPLTSISENISERINHYTYQILDHLDNIPWSNDLKNNLTQCFLNYCPPTLRTQFQARMLEEIPEHHKKAIVACHIAAQLIYEKGLDWESTIVDVLPMLLAQRETTDEINRNIK